LIRKVKKAVSEEFEAKEAIAQTFTGVDSKRELR
jgi:hypothetical protein